MTANKATIQAGNITTLASIIVNVLLCAVKTVIGFITGSTALIADGIHSLADLITDIFAYAILRVAHTGPDESHPYGHGKFETFGTMFLALFLAGAALAIGLEAIDALQHHDKVEPLHYSALLAAIFSILANEGLYHFCTYKGKQVNSPIILANAWHHRTDSLSSVAAVIGIGLNMLGFLTADAIAALVVTLFLLKIAYQIGYGAFNELVDASVDEETLEKIRTSIINNNGVIGFHQLRARRIAGQLFIDVHADVPFDISVSEGHAIAHSIEESLFKDIDHVADITVHIDPFKAQQSALPQTLYRENLEPAIRQILKHHKKDIEIDHLYIHILEDGVYADIRLKPVKLTQTDIQSIRKQLEGEKTPLKEVTLSIGV